MLLETQRSVSEIGNMEGGCHARHGDIDGVTEYFEADAANAIGLGK
jgi:hypothetical protein